MKVSSASPLSVGAVLPDADLLGRVGLAGAADGPVGERDVLARRGRRSPSSEVHGTALNLSRRLVGALELGGDAAQLVHLRRRRRRWSRRTRGSCSRARGCAPAPELGTVDVGVELAVASGRAQHRSSASRRPAGRRGSSIGVPTVDVVLVAVGLLGGDLLAASTPSAPISVERVRGVELAQVAPVLDRLEGRGADDAARRPGRTRPRSPCRAGSRRSCCWLRMASMTAWRSVFACLATVLGVSRSSELRWGWRWQSLRSHG